MFVDKARENIIIVTLLNSDSVADMPNSNLEVLILEAFIQGHHLIINGGGVFEHGAINIDVI